MKGPGPSGWRALLQQPLAQGAVAAGLIALVTLATLPGRPRILVVLNDAAHAPVFGALALLCLALLRTPPIRLGRGLFPVAFVATVLLGIAVEWLQAQIGRDASWADVRTDALGATCALGLAGFWSARHDGPRAGWRLRLAALSLAGVAAALVFWPIGEAVGAYARRAQLFPTLAVFEQRRDRYFLEVSHGDIEFAELPPAWRRTGDAGSLRLDLSGGRWPGVALTEPQPDWRGYAALHLDLTNPGREPVGITVRVHDAGHNQHFDDRFHRNFVLQPGTREELRIPLAEVEAAPVGRRLDLARVAGLAVFASDHLAAPGREIYLTRVWLD